MKIKEFITQHKVKIGIVTLGIAIAGGIAYWFYKKLDKQDQTRTPPPLPPSISLSASEQSKFQADTTRQQKKSEIKPQVKSYDQKFTRIVNQIRALLDASGNQISQQVIKAVIRGQYQLQNQQMKALVYKSRKQRRKNIEDGLEYATIMTKYQYDTQQIQEKHLGTILARFNIDKASWKQSTNAWQQKDEQGFSDLIRDQEQKLLMSYRNESVKPKQYIIIQNIFRFKIKTLQVLNPSIIGADQAADDAARYEMIESYVNDIIFEKFGVEQEDIQYSISLLNKSQKQKIVQLEDKITQIMERFIDIKLNEKESDFY